MTEGTVVIAALLVVILVVVVAISWAIGAYAPGAFTW